MFGMRKKDKPEEVTDVEDSEEETEEQEEETEYSDYQAEVTGKASVLLDEANLDGDLLEEANYLKDNIGDDQDAERFLYFVIQLVNFERCR